MPGSASAGTLGSQGEGLWKGLQRTVGLRGSVWEHEGSGGASGKRVVRAQGHRDGQIAGLPAPGAGVRVRTLDVCPLATGPLG